MVDMKTPIAIPESLLKRVSQRALRNGRQVEDFIVELLSNGLRQFEQDHDAREVCVDIDTRTGFPVIPCEPAIHPSHELTPDRVSELLAEQDSVGLS